MNRTLIIAGIILFLLGAGVLAAVFIFSSKKEEPAPITNEQTTFPTSTTDTGQGIGTLQIQTQGTTTMAATDFTKNGITIADPNDPDTYFLQGSVGYCLGDGTCPHAGSSTDFVVTYSKKYGDFTVALLTEPIGAVRQKAEQFLMRTLGLTQHQMCALKYEVLVSYQINETYTGRNLGFSFCPGALKLPQ